MAQEEQAAKTIVFTYEIEHNLNIQVRNGQILFDESQQKIFITKMSVKPSVELTRVEMLAHYPQGTNKAIQEAVGKILNISAKSAPARDVRTVKTAEEILKQRATEKPGEKEGGEKVNEAAMPDMDIQVITDMLDVPTQVTIEDDKFSVVTRPDEMSQFVTFRQSKKIKVLINGRDFQPKQEIEFVKRVFPQIEMTAYLK